MHGLSPAPMSMTRPDEISCLVIISAYFLTGPPSSLLSTKLSP